MFFQGGICVRVRPLSASHLQVAFSRMQRDSDFFFSSFLAFPKGKLNIEHAAFFSAITLRASEATFSAQMALCVSVFPHIDSISKGNTNNVPLVKS